MRQGYALADRPGDLPLLVVVDLARRAVELPPLLLGPVPDRVVGLEDLGELPVALRHAGDGDLPGGQYAVALGGRHAHLDGAVLLLVHGAVVEHERRARALDLSPQLVGRADDEAP